MYVTALSKPGRRHDELSKAPRGTSIADVITKPDTHQSHRQKRGDICLSSSTGLLRMSSTYETLSTSYTVLIYRFRAMNGQQNERIIRWSEDGNTVVRVNEQELTTKLLPAFNITNYFSLTQQLEKLGFRAGL